MKKYFFLMRLDRPVGFMLLFWPCAWGFAIVLSQGPMDNNWLAYLILFFVGSILMRSAGCVYNDIIDKKIDQNVRRTKFRQIASGKVSIRKAWALTIFLSLLSLLILFQFNLKAIIFGLSSGILIGLYPFMKRITYWPQLFLGIVFNWGVILSYLVFIDEINLEIILIYISAILWTLGYDTIYGLQDIYDDIRIGVKSTSIKFKKNINLFVGIMYLTSLALLFYLFKNFIGINFFSFLLLLFVFSLLIQIFIFNIKNSESCLKMFKLNNVSGLILFLSILTLNY